MFFTYENGKNEGENLKSGFLKLFSSSSVHALGRQHNATVRMQPKN